ncbi:MAG: hypothetical protein ABI199_06835 [Bacteroidia bacterium]
MRNRYLTFLSFLFVTQTLFSQETGTSYKDKFTEGNYLLLEQNYPIALQNFLDAYHIDSSNANINYKVGLCYLNSSSQKNKALLFLEKAVQNVSKNYDYLGVGEKHAPINAYYYLGRAYHLAYRFDDAIASYQKFETFLKKRDGDLKSDADHQIEMCQNGKLFYAAPGDVRITNLGDSVNSIYPDYCPVLSADENTLIFTSRRPDNTIGNQKTIDDQYYEHIYICYKKADGTWTSPVSISSNINSDGVNNATVGLSADGQSLLIFKGDVGGGDLYISTLNGNDWTKPIALGSDINTNSWEPSASISADGNTIYFVSDRKGGLGGRDIWKCVKLPNGEWSKASNLGAPINTPYDEDGPFIHPDGKTLFFSSKGHNSMGGFDVFYSIKSDTGWSKPQNMGYPINTPDDEVYYVVSPDGKRAYYSSDKAGGYGEKDIYMINFPHSVEQPLTLIKGVITPPAGQELPDGITIVVTNTTSGETVGTYKPIKRNGNYTFILQPNADYKVSYQLNDKEFYSEDINVPAGSSFQELDRAIKLDEVNMHGGIAAALDSVTKPKADNKKINTSGLEYALFFKYNVNEIDVNETSFKQFVDTLYTTLQNNPNLKIVIESSASKVPTRKYKSNKKLAELRANHAKEQIVTALKAKGLGKSQLKFHKKALVGGPKYNADYELRKAIYEQFQFVKIKLE